ncbi:hypothetical protein B5P43_18490 [Bacillus sp. SRB_336]|nr:hypothetical protein B5P43_18490 [Bacillus sp. SRB_336]
MATALYDSGREGILDSSINWTTGTIKAILIDTGTYSVNLATDKFQSDIPSGARIAVSPALTSKTATGGVANAAGVTFSAVVGASVEAVVLFQDTGVAGTSRLIAYIDSGTGLPVTPNSGDISIAWNTGANKIFKL